MSHCEYREFWINGWDPKEYPLKDDELIEVFVSNRKLHSRDEGFLVREVHPQEAEIKRLKSESVKNRIVELEAEVAQLKEVIAIMNQVPKNTGVAK